jgi:hypothetical protein
MSIEELHEKVEELYLQHNQVYRAWMHAQNELEQAILAEVELERRSYLARRNVCLAFFSFGVAVMISKLWT